MHSTDSYLLHMADDLSSGYCLGEGGQGFGSLGSVGKAGHFWSAGCWGGCILDSIQCVLSRLGWFVSRLVFYVCGCWWVTKSCSTLWDPVNCSPPGTHYPWDFPGRNSGMHCHFLLQGIFPTKGSNLLLLHWQEDPLPQSHQGSSFVSVSVRVQSHQDCVHQSLHPVILFRKSACPVLIYLQCNDLFKTWVILWMTSSWSWMKPYFLF